MRELPDPWPDLDYAKWRDTALALQLWLQVIGKVRLTLTPWLNHSWQVPFYVTARGLGTSTIPLGKDMIDLEFDFIGHRLTGRASHGAMAELALKPMSVAEFYGGALGLLRSLGADLSINPLPSELPNPLAFGDDRKIRPYDADAVHRFWRALLQADRLFKLFRTGFLGKASPVHLFWGGFDLAVTRFSGRRAPRHPRRHPRPFRPGDARSLFARSQQRRFLAGFRRVSQARLLFLCLSSTGRICGCCHARRRVL